LGVTGSERRAISLKDGDKKSEQVNEFEKLVEDVKGHALTLTLLGGFLKRAFHGDIRQRDRVKFEKADAQMDGGHAFRTMAAYEQWLLQDGGAEGRREVAVLHLMGLFDRPAEAGCLHALLQPPAIPGLTDPLVGRAAEDLEFCITGLESARLLTVNRKGSADHHSSLITFQFLDCHPHLREYFARQLRTQQPDAWRAAHQRLYEHLCATTKEGDQPTLEELQPLYQAVVHGCHAGMHREACNNVYKRRILRLPSFWSSKQLGAFGSDLGAVACFFEQTWNLVSHRLTDDDRAWLLNQTAVRLRALGRLREAVEPSRATVRINASNRRWEDAAVCASNLSELELTMGEVDGAMGDAEQAVTYADRGRVTFWKTTSRATHANALHSAGRSTEAEARFREAEQMQQESQTSYPLLYSLRGFLYCDFLLAASERSAWQVTVNRSTLCDPPSSTLVGQCHEIEDRAAQTLKWVEAARMDILSIALDHLTLGRAGLYAAILSNLSLDTCHSSLNAAVSELRRAGTTHHLPLALITRAWLRFIAGVLTGPESARADLDQAWEIAERGPMRLFLADIHLHRARLFFRENDYPWNRSPDGSLRGPKDDLEAAEKLIHTCGYHRRDEELADAKVAVQQFHAKSGR
jgi:hypothetical protein